jgi:starvation-inducible DNA-binding protein
MWKSTIHAGTILRQARPQAHQDAHEIQPYGHVITLPIAFEESLCRERCESRQLLADT